jgi:DNA-binding transcriptional ArsR family regulator
VAPDTTDTRQLGDTGQNVLKDADALRAVADPVRLRMALLLMDGDRTVKELAAALRVPTTRLYYHMRILERHGLVEVAERRMVSGIEERRYRLTGDGWTVSPDIAAGALGETGALSAVMAVVGTEVDVVVRGEKGAVGDPGSALPVIALTELVLDRDEMVEVQERLQAIMQEFGAGRARPPAGARNYHFLFLGYPKPGPAHAS